MYPKGEFTMMQKKGALGNMIFAIISLAIVVIVLTSVFITTTKSANTSGWTAGEIALWGTVTLNNTGALDGDIGINFAEKTEKLQNGQLARKSLNNINDTHNAYGLTLETEYNVRKSLQHLSEMKIYADHHGNMMNDWIKSQSDNSQEWQSQDSSIQSLQRSAWFEA